MRSPLLAGLGAIAVLIGGLWVGQGLGLVRGSVMTGSNQWLIIGAIALILGVLLIVYGTRSRKKPSTPPDL